MTRNDIKGTPEYNFSLPEPVTLDAALRDLKKAVKDATEDTDLASRILGWGIRGEDLRVLHHALLERDTASNASNSATKGDDESRLSALMSIWAKEALADLQRHSISGGATSSTFLDVENARHALEAEGHVPLRRIMVASFLDWLEVQARTMHGLNYIVSQLASLRRATDLRFLSLQHGHARTLKRQIHLHVGPTNSGKTHGALVALCNARKGLYAGPLRLLAHEVWDRVNSGTVSPNVAPRPCNLVTGEEIRIVDRQAGLTACTVEMSPLDQMMDVAVIDEIQMIADTERGPAWTEAVFGVAAKELHLCGEASVVPLIKQIAKMCGDDVHVHEYQRLTPLEVGDDLKGQIENIRKGDCVVAFSRSDIFNTKRLIEERLGLKCAVAYGALPPETKAEQAKLFNDSDNDVDVMVASDAIGMGLNLKIKRVIFQAISKWNGSEQVVMSSSQIKQIAGRAGRYGTNNSGHDAGGLATTMYSKDIGVLRDALKAPLLPIGRAAVQPTGDMMASLSMLLPPILQSTDVPAEASIGQPRPITELYTDVSLLLRIDSSICFASKLVQQKKLAPIIEAAVPPSVKLTIAERERFTSAPANVRDERLVMLLSNLIRWFAKGSLVPFEEVERGLGMLDALQEVERVTGCRAYFKNASEATAMGKSSPAQPKAAEVAKDDDINDGDERLAAAADELDANMLMILESLHRGLTLYLWLSFRFPLAFCFGKHVVELKTRTEHAIEMCLAAIRAGRRRRLAKLGRSDERPVRQRFNKDSFSASVQEKDGRFDHTRFGERKKHCQQHHGGGKTIGQRDVFASLEHARAAQTGSPN